MTWKISGKLTEDYKETMQRQTVCVVGMGPVLLQATASDKTSSPSSIKYINRSSLICFSLPLILVIRCSRSVKFTQLISRKNTAHLC